MINFFLYAITLVSVFIGIFALYRFYQYFQVGYVPQGSLFLFAGLVFIFFIPYLVFSSGAPEERQGVNVAVRQAGHGYIFVENVEEGMMMRISNIHHTEKSFSVNFSCESERCGELPEDRSVVLGSAQTVEEFFPVKESEQDYVMKVDVYIEGSIYDELELKVS